MPPLVDLPRSSVHHLPEGVKAVQLLPAWPDTCEAQYIAETAALPSIHLFFPLPRIYTSGEMIPLAVGLTCSSSPALVKLYAPGVSIQLVKRRRIWFSAGQQISVRDTQLSTSTPSGLVDYNVGEAYLSYRLEAGGIGSEASLGVEGTIEVSYFIRVIVRPPQDVRKLPVFRVDEPIQLTTDLYDTLETEVLTGGASAPALGLTVLRPAALFR